LKNNIDILNLNNMDELCIRAFDIFYSLHNASTNNFYVIPGGKTPRFFYSYLANKVSNWRNALFILSDERMTSNMSLSNTAMVNDIFINSCESIPKPSLINYNLNGSQSFIEEKIKKLRPKLAILGMGIDGHIASLFPYNSQNFSSNKNITIKVKNTWENFDRISLSFNYLMRSEQIIFLISGKEKMRTLKKCLKDDYDPEKFPIQFIFHHFSRKINILCDNI